MRVERPARRHVALRATGGRRSLPYDGRRGDASSAGHCKVFGGMSVAVSERPTVQAKIDTDLWALFTRSGEGWTGGDSTYSVVLPDGRVAWIFSDTFLGPVNPDRTRPRSAPLIHNSIVVQDGDQLRTLHGGTRRAPRSLFTPVNGGSWYWAYAGVIEEDWLRVFLLKFVRYGPEMFDWRWVGADLASLHLPDLSVDAIEPVPYRTGVQYGAAILEDGDYTYVYGVEDLHAVKYGHVARAKRGALSGPWEFFAGRRWSSLPEGSARMLDASIGNEYSVLKTERGYMLVTMDTAVDLTEWREIVAYSSDTPAGPWSGRTVLYTAPEPDRENLFVYNAQAHPALSKEGELLITYNVNTARFDALYEDADVYRARFVRVQGVREHDRAPNA
ncbi:MAG: DUF5005 domain-containing protein, partial [Dehalococcoidia bacterium]